MRHVQQIIHVSGLCNTCNPPQIKEYLESRGDDMSSLSPDWFVFSAAAILEKELEYESQGE